MPLQTNPLTGREILMVRILIDTRNGQVLGLFSPNKQGESHLKEESHIYRAMERIGIAREEELCGFNAGHLVGGIITYEQGSGQFTGVLTSTTLEPENPETNKPAVTHTREHLVKAEKILEEYLSRSEIKNHHRIACQLEARTA
jgi:hypothetical protein